MERYLTKFDPEYVAPVQTEEVIIEYSQPEKRRLTEEEIKYWYYKRGTIDENGVEIGYGTIAKNLGVEKYTVKNAFTAYERKLQKNK